MGLPTIVIIEGARAERYIEIGEDGRNLKRLREAGIIRPASDADREKLAEVKMVYYGRGGGSWGSGKYVLEQADSLYVMASGFNLGHLELAIRRMVDKQRENKRNDLFGRIDKTFGGTD